MRFSEALRGAGYPTVLRIFFVMVLALFYALLVSSYIFGSLIASAFYGLKSAPLRETTSGPLIKIIENGLLIWYGREEYY